MDVSPCVAEPCELKKGTNESIEIQFIPSKYWIVTLVPQCHFGGELKVLVMLITFNYES